MLRNLIAPWMDKFPPTSSLLREEANAIAEKWWEALRGR